MISSPIRARQPLRQPWTHERLLRERAITLGQAINNSTWKNYGSALNSYLNFIKLHDFPVKPTPDTLSLFTVYMCHHIKPTSVATYLSGICQQLEPYFPNICSARNSALVHRTLQGCRRLSATPTSRKCALTLGDLETIVNALTDSSDYDNQLFLAQLLTGFFALFRLGEMTYPDDPDLCDPPAKSPSATPSASLMTLSNCSCLAIRPTGSLRETSSSFAKILTYLILTNTSCHTYERATTSSPSAPHSG